MSDFKEVKLGKYSGQKTGLASIQVELELLDIAQQAQHESDVFLDCGYVLETLTGEGFDEYVELRKLCEEAIKQGVYTLSLYS